MPRQRTLRDRMYDITNSIETTRVRTAGLDVVSREDLRDAVRALADALEDLAAIYRVTHLDEMAQPDIRGHRRRQSPPATGN